jgi:hypothetical protein
MELKCSFLLRDLDKTLAIAGAIFSIILIFYMAREIGRLIYLLTGVLTLLSCLLWLAIRRSHPFEFHIPKSRTLTHLWATGFFVLFILSVLSVYFRSNLYERPIIYFILTASMAGIIACEIFTSGRQHTGLILIQALLLGVSLAWSQLLIFPGLLGVDPWYHYALTTNILDTSYIPDGYIYSKLPLYHLMVAATSLVADLPYKYAVMVSVSLAQILCNVLFVSLIGGRLFKSYRVGLLAALMVIIANHHIFMSYWSIPNAFAAIFIPIFIYILFFKFESRSSYSPTILYSIMMVSVILTHTITAVCMGMLLVIVWVAPFLYRINHSHVKKFVTLMIPVGFIVAMFAWWAYATSILNPLSNLINFGFSADIFVQTSNDIKSYAASVPFQEQLITYLGLFLFFSISFIGIFYMISRKGNGSTFAMAWVGIAPLAVGFFSLISGRSVINERWWYFAQILLSVPLAVAFFIVGTWKIRKLNFLYCFTFVSIFALSFLLIISPSANVDNHALSPVTGSTDAYTESELIATEFFAAKTEGLLSSDSDYCSNPSSSIFINVYNLQPAKLRDLDSSLITGEFEHDGSTMIIRTSRIREPLTSGGLAFWLRPDLNDYMSSLSFNKIYENTVMAGYTG